MPTAWFGIVSPSGWVHGRRPGLRNSMALSFGRLASSQPYTLNGSLRVLWIMTRDGVNEVIYPKRFYLHKIYSYFRKTALSLFRKPPRRDSEPVVVCHLVRHFYKSNRFG